MKYATNYYLLILVILLFIVACAKKTTQIETIDGITIYKNSQNPANINFTISFKEEFVIPYDPATTDTTNRQIRSFLMLTTDSDGKIFVADNYSCNIKIFDKKGNYLKTFGKKGNGPGEITNLASLFIAKDTIYVSDQFNKSISLFNKQGEYIKSLYTGKQMGFAFPVSDNYFVCSTINGVELKNKVVILSKLVLSSKKFNYIKTLDSISTDYNPSQLNLADLVFPFAFDNSGNMFTALISEDRYEIKKNDSTGKLVGKISKPFSKTEIDSMQKKIIRANSNAENIENEFSKKAYNKAIHGIWTDKDNRLWVLPAKKVSDNCLYFDVFENSIYQNTVKVDFCNTVPSLFMLTNWTFSGKYLFWNDTKKNQIRVFSYN